MLPGTSTPMQMTAASSRTAQIISLMKLCLEFIAVSVFLPSLLQLLDVPLDREPS